MLFDPQLFRLQDGTQGVLRMANKADAPSILETLIKIAETSPYILVTPEKARKMSIEDEEKWIENNNSSPGSILIIACIGSQVVGITNFASFTNPKNKHRGSLGTSVHPNFHRLGLGFQMMSLLLHNIRRMETIRSVELDVMAPNSNAIKLYKKLGFEEVGRKPNAFLMTDGSYVDEIAMQLWLHPKTQL